jgi:hypothetical protein
MNSKYMVVVAAMAVMLIGTTAFATNNAFATYGKSQAIAQANECGNGVMAMYVFCQNTGSQVQGKYNAQALDSFQQGEEDHKDKKHDDGHGKDKKDKDW